MSRAIIFKENDTYSHLTIIREVEPVIYGNNKKQRMVFCSCECGNTKNINLYHLLKGNVKSCGCLYTTISSKNSIKHKMYNTPEYLSWKSMKSRCTNPKATGYKNYGERGIKICDRWLNSFEDFLTDMGKRPEGYSLDRINPNGNYEVSNCRWATTQEQSNNKRKK